MCVSFVLLEILLQLLGYVVFHSLRFRAGVVVAVTLQEVDDTPHAEAGSEGDDERFQHVDCRCKKFHNRH